MNNKRSNIEGVKSAANTEFSTIEDNMPTTMNTIVESNEVSINSNYQ
jgi:hypothetical protein